MVSPRIGDTPGQPHPLAKLDRGVNSAIPGLFRAPGVLLPGKKRVECPKNSKVWDKKGGKNGSRLGLARIPREWPYQCPGRHHGVDGGSVLGGLAGPGLGTKKKSPEWLKGSIWGSRRSQTEVTPLRKEFSLGKGGQEWKGLREVWSCRPRTCPRNGRTSGDQAGGQSRVGPDDRGEFFQPQYSRDSGWEGTFPALTGFWPGFFTPTSA